MSLVFSFNETAAVGLVGRLTDWGPAVPTHGENLKRLRLWRALLGDLTLEQRADWAAHPALMQIAVNYAPAKNRDGRERPLDWGGIHPEATPYEGTRKELEDLLEEQAIWLSEGLIPGATRSSSEWPAAALLHAAIQTKRPVPSLHEVLKRAISEGLTSVLALAAPMVPVNEWEGLLKTPFRGHADNPAIFFDLLGQPEEAKAILPHLPPSVVDMRRKNGSNGFFDMRIPLVDIPVWVKAGMDPSARDEKGRFAEQRQAYREGMDAMHYLKALNAHRSPHEAELATWRFAVESIEYLGGRPQDQILIESLLVPPPADPLSGSSVLEQLERDSDEGRYLDSAIPKKLAEFLQNMLGPQGLLPSWAALQGGPDRVTAFLLAASMHESAELKPVDALRAVEGLPLDAERVVLEVFKTPVNNSLYAAAPYRGRNRSEYTSLVKSFLEQPGLRHTEDWLEFLPALETPLSRASTGGESKQLLASTLNVLAHVMPHLPADAMGEEHFFPVLWKLNIANALAEWDDLEDHLDGSCPIVDRTAFNAILESAMDQPGMGSWWANQPEWFQGHVKIKSPDLFSRFEGARLNDVFSKAAPRSKIRM